METPAAHAAPPAPLADTSSKAAAPPPSAEKTKETCGGARGAWAAKGKKEAKGSWTSDVRRALERAEAQAKAFLDRGDHSTEAVETVLTGMGGSWPTQVRNNVSPDAKPVTGMCFGAVNVLGGVGIQLSAVSQNFPRTTELVCAWTRRELPGFPFSCLQINYNYAAKKHVDGNNIGPSYIVSLGEHSGGALWVADTYVEKTQEDGSKVLRGGGGEAVVECHRRWKIFDGNSEHETQPFGPVAGASKACRISIVAFTHSSYNKLDPETAVDVRNLGFTAGSSDGEELAYFKPFRIDKSELGGEALESYFQLRASRKAARPPPTAEGSVAVECNGYSAGKGAGWLSFVTGARAKKARIDSFFKPKNAAKKSGPSTFDLPKPRNNVSAKLEAPPTVDSDNVVRVELPKNRVGLWYCELDLKASGALAATAFERWDLYNKSFEEQTAKFKAHVEGLAPGTAVLISITDTAMAKTRPLPKGVYETLRLLGAPEHIEPIGYRMPFAMIGVRGGAPGSAMLALDKTKVILRLEARLARNAEGLVEVLDQVIERTDITEHILGEEKGEENAEEPSAEPMAVAA